ncbi:hypothetical protein EYC80_002557 [Monilinia laxa]|nr:hypothetical protein EYC80_002557 [Monilinia laxa]
MIAKANTGGALPVMPELQHPSPRRNTHHEILIEGYGSGFENHYTNHSMRTHTKEGFSMRGFTREGYSMRETIREEQTPHRKPSPSLSMTSSNDVPSQWSDSSHDTDGTSFESSDADSPRTSGSFTTHNRRGSISSTYSDTDSLDQPFGFERLKLLRPTSTTYSVSIYDEDMKAEKPLPSPLFSPTRLPGNRYLGPPPRSILKPSAHRVSVLSQNAHRHASFGSVMVMNEELAAYLRV